MPNIFFAVFLALFYSIVYTVAGPVIAAQDIQFDRPPLFSFLLCFIVCTAVNIFLFSVMPRLHSAAGNGRLSRYLDRRFDKVGERRLFLLVWACVMGTRMAHLISRRSILRYDIAGRQRSRRDYE